MLSAYPSTRRMPFEIAGFVEFHSSGRGSRDHMNSGRAGISANLNEPAGQLPSNALSLRSWLHIDMEMRRISCERRAESRGKIGDITNDRFGGRREAINAARDIAGDVPVRG